MKFKQLPWIALITAMTLVISACGGAQQPAAAPTAAPAAPAAEAPTAAPAAEAPVATPTQVIEFAQEPTANQKVVVWMVRTGIDENKWERDVVQPAFAKANPDIFLKVINIAQADITVKREAMIAAKEPLHVWSTNWGGDGFASDRYRGLITDLTPLIERDKFDTTDYIPQILSIYKSEGKQWGLPFLTTGTYVYYNMKLFKDAGVEFPTSDWNDKSWTWDAFVALGKKLTKNYGDPNTGVYGASLDFWPKFDAVPFIWGQDVWSKDAMTTGFSDPIKLNIPPVISAYQKAHDLAFVDKVAPDPAVAQALDQLGGAFASGRVAMSMNGGWGHWSYKSLINDPNGFCWGVAPIPWGTPDANMRATIFTDPWVITAGMDAANTDLAWTFLKFLASPEQAKAYSLTSGAPPTRTSLLTEYYKQYEKCQPVDKFEQAFIGAFSHGRESTNHLLIKYDEASQVWDNAIGPFWNDPNAKATDLMPQLEKDVNDALSRIKTEVKKP
jgi:multiple sugar transport system substrate-binding protein